MTCTECEPDLLPAALGEVSLLALVRTGLHLAVCRRCRVRRRELLAVSRLVAEALRDHGRSRAVPRAPLVPALVLAGLVALVAALLWNSFVRPARPHTASQPAPVGRCP